MALTTSKVKISGKTRPKKLQRHPDKTRAKAWKLYCMGLTSLEISKVVEVPNRTIQNWMQLDGWKEERERERERERKAIIRKYLKEQSQKQCKEKKSKRK
jgi:uncharacterized protein YjcR